MSFSTPIAFVIFNRPSVTRRVLHAIREVRPSMMYVVCDGARAGRPGEDLAVMQARAVLNEVDWPCEVRTDFSDINLGCKRRVSSGLNWVFANCEEAIVLEDDCVPDPTFFQFCQDMLNRYRHDELVFSVAGSNFQGGQSRTNEGYYFSKYFHCWGWATWRRAWKTVDLDLKRWKQFVDAGGLAEVCDASNEERYWGQVLAAQTRGEVDSWAYSCLASSWMNRMLNIIPDVNLVRNIGFDSQATHTTNAPAWIPNTTAQLNRWGYPAFTVRNKAADIFTFKNVYARPNKFRRWKNKIQKQIARLSSRAAA
jgi:hypothetical protein